jgi:hypothetical protein
MRRGSVACKEGEAEFELKSEFPQGGTTGGAKQQQGRASRASA